MWTLRGNMASAPVLLREKKQLTRAVLGDRVLNENELNSYLDVGVVVALCLSFAVIDNYCRPQQIDLLEAGTL